MLGCGPVGGLIEDAGFGVVGRDHHHVAEEVEGVPHVLADEGCIWREADLKVEEGRARLLGRGEVGLEGTGFVFSIALPQCT